MIDHQTRRVAVFQVFTVARASGMNKWQAYNYAQAIVKPVPMDNEDRNIQLAIGHYLAAKRSFFGHAQLSWQEAYRFARENHR